MRARPRQYTYGVVIALLWGAGGQANAEPTAQEIAKKSQERGALNLVDLTAELRLTTAGKDGASKEQVLRSSARRVGGKMRTLARFLSPEGVAGVSVLTVEGASGADEVSLYLPKLRRVRKIAPKQSGEAFMSTDFSYADLGAAGTGPEDKLTRKPDAAAEGRTCYVVQGPGDESSPYGEVTVFVDQQTYVPMRVEYRDRQGSLVKVFRTLKLKRFGDRTLAAEAVMENLATGSKTTLTVLRLEPSTLTDEELSERALERG